MVLLTGLVIGQKQFEKFMGLCIVFNAACSVHVNNNMKRNMFSGAQYNAKQCTAVSGVCVLVKGGGGGGGG